jgi:hypothetical protein
MWDWERRGIGVERKLVNLRESGSLVFKKYGERGGSLRSLGISGFHGPSSELRAASCQRLILVKIYVCLGYSSFGLK